MATRGLHFSGQTNEQVAETMRRVESVAADLGFLTTRGRRAGHGNVAAMLVAIARGDVMVVVAPDHCKIP